MEGCHISDVRRRLDGTLFVRLDPSGSEAQEADEALPTGLRPKTEDYFEKMVWRNYVGAACGSLRGLQCRGG